MKKRMSNIELLKIIGIILITIQHVLTTTNYTFGVASNDWNLIIANMFRCIGYIGNTLFIICSAYFLLDSKSTSKKKILYMISDVFIISIIWLIPFLIFKFDLSLKDYVREFFPIICKNNWFIGCYILLYLIHPLLNNIINLTDKKKLFRIDILLLLLYFIIQFLIKDALFFNELLYFISLYFIVAYAKKYMNEFNKNKKINIVILILSLSLYLLSTIIINYLGLHFNFLSDKILYFTHNIANPFVLLISVTMFNLFNMKPFYNSFINKISQLSLLYYVIHENILFRTYLRPKIFIELTKVINNNFVVISFMIVSIFIIGMVIAFIYGATLQKLVHKFINKLYNFLQKIYIKFEKRILKIK